MCRTRARNGNATPLRKGAARSAREAHRGARNVDERSMGLKAVEQRQCSDAQLWGYLEIWFLVPHFSFKVGIAWHLDTACKKRGGMFMRVVRLRSWSHWGSAIALDPAAAPKG